MMSLLFVFICVVRFLDCVLYMCMLFLFCLVSCFVYILVLNIVPCSVSFLCVCVLYAVALIVCVEFICFVSFLAFCVAYVCFVCIM